MYGYPGKRSGDLTTDSTAHNLGESAFYEIMKIDHITRETQVEFSRIEYGGVHAEDKQALTGMRENLEGLAQRMRDIRRTLELHERAIMDESGVVPYKQLIEQLAAVLDHVLYVDAAIEQATMISNEMRSHLSSHQAAVDAAAVMDDNIEKMLAFVEERASRPRELEERKNFADTEYIQRTGSLEKWGGKLNQMRLELMQKGALDLALLKNLWDKILNTKALGPGDCSVKAELLYGTGGCEWLYNRAKLSTLRLEPAN